MQTSKLIDDLKTYDLASSTTTATPTSIDTDATRPIAGSGPTLALGTMLENAMEELFVPFVEGSGSNGTDKYLERESKSLGELYVTFLERFTKFHVCTPSTLDDCTGPTDRVSKRARKKP